MDHQRMNSVTGFVSLLWLPLHLVDPTRLSTLPSTLGNTVTNEPFTARFSRAILSK